jgi:hypothetical protein
VKGVGVVRLVEKAKSRVAIRRSSNRTREDGIDETLMLDAYTNAKVSLPIRQMLNPSSAMMITQPINPLRNAPSQTQILLPIPTPATSQKPARTLKHLNQRTQIIQSSVKILISARKEVIIHNKQTKHE